MNSQKYKIQALIAEIDEVLSKPAPRLPWTGSLDTVHQRQLLERVRAYLASADSKAAASKGPASPNVRPQPVPVPKVPLPAPRPSAADQIMLAVTGEINHLRSSLTEPLQQEIEALRQQQQALIQEIKQLEAKRQQQQSLAQQQANQQQIISEFLQVLTARLEETLARDFSQILASPENQLLLLGAAPYSLGSGRSSEQPALEVTLNQQTSPEQPLLTPAQRLEQIQSFQARADSLLRRLDSTVDSVFDALQANLETHQASLSQGIENMYGLSQQSEAMFAAFVNHLAEQLGREASSYVPKGPIAIANLESAPPASSKEAIDSSATAYRSGGFPEQDRLPYAGTEISPQFGQLRRDRDLRQDGPISLPDLADNLSGYAPERPGSQTQFPGVKPEDTVAETGANVEDLYASLFAAESVAELELELEDFTIENTENTVEFASTKTVNQAGYERTETVNTTEELFANLLDEGESLEDILVGEDSDFIIGNSADELTLDTEDLFQPQVAAVPQVSEPQKQPIAGPEIDADDRPNLETAQNRGEDFDSPNADRTRPSPPPLALPEITPNRPSSGTRQPSARDVRTGEFDTPSQRLDDAYIQASPDEDLLPVEVLEDDLDRALNLDNNTLELLETDLYNLEGLSNTGTGRSNSSEANSLDLSASSQGRTQNPFGEDAEEEPGTLEDLFSDVLGFSSDEDEPFVLEDELDDDLFAGEDESKLTLDEILAGLTETDPATATTDEVRSSPPESKKKT